MNIKNGLLKRPFLYIGILFLSLPLLTFKLSYYNYFKNLEIFGFDTTYTNSIIGLSFYSVVLIGYIIEIYRNNIPFKQSFSDYVIYISFFPCFLSGPIEKPQNLLRQINNNSFIVNEPDISSGLRLILLGVIKKALIADKISIVASNVFDNYWKFDGLAYMIAVFLYAIQIYCDFSGYSDISIGIARTFGIRLTNNFNFPYSSKSISEFWQRWHISLSVWLRDYIFLPLSYILHRNITFIKNIKLKEKFIYSFSSIVTMLICGFWHGPSINFLIWGLIFGIYLTIGILTKKFRGKILKKIKFIPLFIINRAKIFMTFFFVCLAWVFFRSDNLNQVWHILGNLFCGFDLGSVEMGFTSKNDFIINVIIIIFFFLIQFFLKRSFLKEIFYKLPIWIKWAFYYAVIIFILYYGNFDTTKFIYSRF